MTTPEHMLNEDALSADAGVRWRPGRSVKILVLAGALLFWGLAGAYATVSMSAQWTRTYNEAGNKDDIPVGVAVGPKGAVYVTGWSASDYTTIKRDAQGRLKWIRRYTGPSAWGVDYPAGVAVDGDGNAYVAGISPGEFGIPDIATVKYGPRGVEKWARRFDGKAHSSDGATGLAITRGGVYVTGYTYEPAGGWDFVTMKYNSIGRRRWVNRYASPGSATDYALYVTADATGNAYVTGVSASDYTTIKYGPTGKQLWVRAYNGPGGKLDKPTGIAVDKAGNVIVTGESPGTDLGYDYATVKYDTFGKKQWVRRYDGLGSYWNLAKAVGVDSTGAVYVTGTSYGWDSGTDDYVTIKYDRAGNQVWLKRYTPFSLPVAMVVNERGDSYITGAPRGWGYATLKYDTAGNKVWSHVYKNPDYRMPEAKAIAVGGNGNVYVTGTGVTPRGDRDVMTVKYKE